MSIRPLAADAPSVDSQSATSEQTPHREPIAIVGMGCRFPGAHNPNEFWNLLCRGDDAIGDAPLDRFDLARLYHPNPGTPGKFSSRRGGYLTGIDQFDADFFDISPREAERLDPQQRLLLEVAWEAVEDAGLVPSQMADAAAGVFIGLWLHDFETHLVGNPLQDDLEQIDFHMTTGTGPYAAAGRLSFALGFRGPCMAIDTACSASLVAVHLACHSLSSGESKVAIAGGVNVILSPYIAVAYSQAKIISPDGRCKFGDAGANGYVRSEGCGMIVLKTLSQARADGDRIYALIRGGAVNNDGRTSHMLVAPGSLGQQEVIRKAYQQSGVSAARVQYVEAHGTGTEAGDPIELGALGAVLGPGRPADRPCLVGSVKTNIGHTESASGIAGLMKVACALHHGLIPPSLHFHQPNPAIPWQSLPVEVVTSLRPWPAQDGPATAGVSSYGIAGTNAHIVLEAAPTDSAAAVAPSAAPLVLPLSARSPAALAAWVATMRERIASAPSSESLDDVCYTAALRREHHRYRLAIVAADRTELVQHLDALIADGLAQAPDQAYDRKLAFVYSGQGAQWIGMGRQLLHSEPVFRDMIQQCDLHLQPLAGWSLVEELSAEPDRSRLQQTEVAQPVIFAIQMALTALWRSWGIEPGAVVGHSIGEVTAACVAGMLSLEDAIRVIYHRGRLMQQATGRGRMVAVQMNAATAKELAARFGGRLSLAAANGPQSVVLAGEPAAVDELVAELGKREVACRKLPVDYAFHSPQMAPYQSELTAALRGLSTRPAALTIVSTVTGQAAREGDFDAAYWARNIREPVLFGPAIEQLTAAGYNVFMEIAPHPVLARDIVQSGTVDNEVRALPSLRRDCDERRTMLESLAELYTFGWPVAWSALFPQGGHFAALPTYPWDRQRYWFEAQPSLNSARTVASPGPAEQLHVLLGSHLESAAEPGTHYWQTEITPSLFPIARERRAGGALVLPTAEVIDAALATGELLCGASDVELHSVSFEYSLVISAAAPTKIQVVGRTTHEEVAAIEFYAWEPAASGWSLYARAAIGAVRASRESAPFERRRGPAAETNGARSKQRDNHRAGAPATHAADRLAVPATIVEHVESLAPTKAIEDDRRLAGVLIPEMERLSILYVAGALRKLGLELVPAARFREEDLARALRIAPRHRRLFSRLFEMLAEEGYLIQAADEWRIAGAPPATDPESVWQSLRGRFPACGPELELFGRCGRNLAEVLRGEVDPIGLLFPSGSLETAAALYRDACFSRTANWRLSEALQAAIAGVPTGRELRVLEIGAGTGGLTHHVLPLLPQDSTSYSFTDVGNWFLSQAQEKFAGFAGMRFETLDIEREPSEQGFAAAGYDIVLAANCLHATRDLSGTLSHVRRLLAPRGLLLLIEGTTARRWIDLIFGLTEGWWLFTDRELRSHHPLLAPESWQALLEEVGFEAAAVVRPAVAHELFPQSIVIAREPRTSATRSRLPAPPRTATGKAPAPQASPRPNAETAPAAAANGEAAGVKVLRSALRAATTDPARRQVMEGHLLEQLSQLLKLPPARLDRHKPFTALGLDSLSAMGLQGRLQASTELTFSPTVIWNYPNIAALAGYLLKEISAAMSEPDHAATATPASVPTGNGATANGAAVTLPPDDQLHALLSDIEKLSSDEARRLLGNE